MVKAAKKAAGGSLGLSKYNVQSVHDTHKNDEALQTNAGDLPAGIEMGIAKINDCKIGTYKQGDFTGERFFMVSAICVAVLDEQGNWSSKFNGMDVKGGRTQIGPEPLCDTPQSRGKKTTFEDHWTFMSDIIKFRIGQEEAFVAMSDPDTELEPLCEAIKSGEIYIIFRTWKGEKTPEFPNPRLQHEWKRPATQEEIDAAEGSLEDGVEEAAEPTQAPAKKVVATKTAPANPPTKKAVKKVAQTEESLEDLATKADNGDSEAAKTLKDKAVELGYNGEEEGEIDSADSWHEVVAMIEAGPKPADDEEAADEGEAEAEVDLTALGEAADGGDTDAVNQLTDLAVVAGLDINDFGPWSDLAAALAAAGDEGAVEDNSAPAVGEVWLYKPYDVKTKKTATKAVKCLVESVDKKKETVTLKNAATKQAYSNVPWAKLEK